MVVAPPTAHRATAQGPPDNALTQRSRIQTTAYLRKVRPACLSKPPRTDRLPPTPTTCTAASCTQRPHQEGVRAR
ncbi:hypothetical protein NDU88_007522 [Pleurodeles waltl]|uniref:Uncharacterized protein n=1 Tax=Pleurodeles waltl TaxID=8319 RepID=A0AAV7SSQ9_PLEWA|nr:hypothetical protein NDU88_007522 [Pleurodeles waltl]